MTKYVTNINKLLFKIITICDLCIPFSQHAYGLEGGGKIGESLVQWVTKRMKIGERLRGVCLEWKGSMGFGSTISLSNGLWLPLSSQPVHKLLVWSIAKWIQMALEVPFCKIHAPFRVRYFAIDNTFLVRSLSSKPNCLHMGSDTAISTMEKQNHPTIPCKNMQKNNYRIALW